MNTPITDVRLENTSTTVQKSLPITFGQVFALGDVKPSDLLVGALAGVTVPLQLDVKATHADGSVRHAVISAIVPSLAAGSTSTMTINTGAAAAGAATPADLIATGFTASTSVTISGVKYSASADQLLKAGTKATWLAGAVANEWLVSAPLTTAAGVAHPHLVARFAIRYYGAIKQARVDVTLENAWAYQPNPQPFTYDAEIAVNGRVVYAKKDLKHYSHARWRKVFWTGAAPAVHIRHNTAYLIASRAVPNYDQSVKISDSFLQTNADAMTGPSFEPMGTGLAASYMPTTGGRYDIGLLPGWSVNYLLSQDKRAKDAMLATADLAGSYSSHFRDQITDAPVSVLDFPYMTILARFSDTGNPKTNKMEGFPDAAPGETLATPNVEDMAHQPGFAYLPYLVTGDYYYLEELLFWSMYNSFSSNPYYREYEKGLFAPDQVRGQAWSFRTAAQAAYITPATHVLKRSVDAILNSNIDWYTAKYVGNPKANKLGIIMAFNDIEYGTNAQPWPDDHFTSAIGYTVELGFTRAAPLLAYKAKYPVSRMVGAGACWIDAAIYDLKIRDSVTSPVYETIGEAYRASHTPEVNATACDSPEMHKLFGNKIGEMNGYAESAMGYPSNLQGALAYASQVAGDDGKRAWSLFMSRSVKPDYSETPQFAILPRTDLAAEAPPVVAPPVLTPPAAKPGKIVVNSNVKMAKLKGLLVEVVDPATWGAAAAFPGVAASTKGGLSLADPALKVGAVYAVRIKNAAGAVVDIIYPLTAVK